MESNKIIFTRRELYDLVWASSMVSLSKKYAISDNGLRKICKRMNIPLPTNGHWVKLQFGKKVKVMALPPPSPEGEKEIILELRKEGDEDFTNDPVKKLAKEIIVQVPERLHSPDELVVAAKQILTAKDKVVHDGTLRTYRDGLDIHVSRAGVSRALLLMDVIIKALRGRGHGIIFKNGETFAKVKGQDLQIKLREQTKRVKGKNSWPDYVPTGIFYFKIDRYPDKEFKDGSRKLEAKLSDIIAWMEVQADKDNARDEERRIEREAERVEKERVRNVVERREKELADFRVLLEKAERWHKSENLRSYIDEVERRDGMGGGKSIPGDTINPKDLVEWVAWARKKADWYDPFVEAVDELLVDVKRN
jgi:hypothetical protein